MSSYLSPRKKSDNYLEIFDDEAKKLIKDAALIAGRNLKDAMSLMDFSKEIREFINCNRCYLLMTTSDENKILSVNNIKKEREDLLLQERSLLRGDNTFCATIKLEENNGIWEYVLIGVGVAGALGQIMTGTGIFLAGSVTVAGALFGVALIIHGVNGLLENYHAAIGDKNYSGPVRNLYEKTATASGLESQYGSFAYGGVDLALSGAGLLRNILRTDARRLFYYLQTDYIRGYKKMSKAGLILEISNDVITAKSMCNAYQKG